MMDTRTILAERLASVRSRIADACSARGPRSRRSDARRRDEDGFPRSRGARGRTRHADLGENRPQELWKKAAAVPTARWHLIGHLQRNKIDRTVPLVSLDSLGRFRAAARSTRRVRPPARDAGTGASGGELQPRSRQGRLRRCRDALADGPDRRHLSGVSIRGLMTMAAYSDNPEDARPAFAELRRLRDELRASYGAGSCRTCRWA